MTTPRSLLLAAGAALLVAAAGCGGSGSAVEGPTIGAAKTYQLDGFSPAGVVRAGRATTVGLRILMPSGAPVTRFRGGNGPHVGIDLLIVRDTLDTFMYVDPPIAPDGRIRQQIVFPRAGDYRVVVDSFPQMANVPTNVQLFRTIHVVGPAAPAVPAPTRVARDHGYRFEIVAGLPVAPVEPAYLTIRVTDRHGRLVTFTPFDGALAHGVFFRAGTLAYFHTHVCTPKVPACASQTAGLPVGKPLGRGLLRVGALLPQAGTWRLFLRTKIAGVELVTPFTLHVR